MENNKKLVAPEVCYLISEIIYDNSRQSIISTIMYNSFLSFEEAQEWIVVYRANGNKGHFKIDKIYTS